jgi:hypothetical protein
LEQKEPTPLLLVDLAEYPCSALQAEQAAQETQIPLVRPTHVSGTLPAVRAQCVEATVISHPKGGISLYVGVGTTTAGPPHE